MTDVAKSQQPRLRVSGVLSLEGICTRGPRSRSNKSRSNTPISSAFNLSEPLRERNCDPSNAASSAVPRPAGPGSSAAPSSSANASRPDKMVRTDPSARSIESYLSHPVLKAAAVRGERGGSRSRSIRPGSRSRSGTRE